MTAFVGIAALVIAPPAAFGASTSLQPSVDQVLAAQQQVVTTNSALPYTSPEAEANLPTYAQNLAYSEMRILLAQRDLNNPVLVSFPYDTTAVGGETLSRPGLQNPDNIYYTPSIDPNQTYVLTIAPGGSADVNISSLAGYGPANETGPRAVQNVNLRTLTPNADGSYTIIVSSTPQPGNWVNSSGANALVIRDTMSHWDAAPARVTLQASAASSGQQISQPRALPMMSNLGTPLNLILNPPTLSDADVAAILGTIATSLPQDNAINNAIGSSLFTRTPPNTLTPVINTSGPGALTTQATSIGNYDLAPGEALVVAVPAIDAGYSGIQLSDTSTQSLPSQYRQTSLSNGQAIPGADGMTYYVISDTDPGVPNWLDSSGHDQGAVVLRWQAINGPLPTTSPQVKVVPVAAVRDYLPADTPVVTPQERTQQLKERAAEQENLQNATRSYSWVTTNLELDDLKAALGTERYNQLFGTPEAATLLQRLGPTYSPDAAAVALAILGNPLGSLSAAANALPQAINDVRLPTVLAAARVSKVLASVEQDTVTAIQTGHPGRILISLASGAANLGSVAAETVFDPSTSITGGVLNARDDLAFAITHNAEVSEVSTVVPARASAAVVSAVHSRSPLALTAAAPVSRLPRTLPTSAINGRSRLAASPVAGLATRPVAGLLRRPRHQERSSATIESAGSTSVQAELGSKRSVAANPGHDKDGD